MIRRTTPAAIAVIAVAIGCGGPPARAPSPGQGHLGAEFSRAFEADAIGEPAEATRRYLEVVDAAAGADGDPWQLPALAASLDALLTRRMSALGAAMDDASLGSRTVQGPAIEAALRRSAANARGAFARGLVARTLATRAQRRGDGVGAAADRAASGCVAQALLIGPTSWAPITGVDEAGPLDRADARIAASYPSGDAFAHDIVPVPVSGYGCAIPLSAASTRPGVRDVAIDLTIPTAQTVGLALRAHGAAALRVAGTPVLKREFDLGDGEAARFARVRVTPGVLRVVVRVGTAKESDTIELDAFTQDGGPLAATAPAVGALADARVLGVEVVHEPDAHDAAEALLGAAGDLAWGAPRVAERRLWPAAAKADAPPNLALAYGRAVETAPDLSAATRAERARSAYERVLEVWPTSWEAIVAHAVLAGIRKGHGEAGAEALRDFDASRERARTSAPSLPLSPVLDAFDAGKSGVERLFDRASAALARAGGSLAGTELLADAEDAATPRVGQDLAAALCDPRRPEPRDTLGCYDALRSTGNHARAATELTRLRAVLGAPRRFTPLEVRDDYAVGDTKAAVEAARRLLPGERSLWELTMNPGAASPLATRLRAAAYGATDAPAALGALLRATGDDPTKEFDGLTERLVAQDRTENLLASAATAVLAHSERYALAADGLLHWVLYDVRRVSGTTDVEENAQAGMPAVWGESAIRVLRRRIMKKDGRVIEPDKSLRASQEHADLSQLEQGDVVEAICEGWALPGDTGDLGFDTPDLMPDRAAVHEATLEVRLPRGLRGAVWSHKLLGAPTETAEGGERVLRWHVAERPARRIEDGVPKMDRNVAVSFSTARWADVARAMREAVAALDERDPELAAWARGAAASAGSGAPPKAVVTAVAAATGEALREADPGALADYAGGVAPVQSQTARTFLSSHAGSRSWLVLRSLRELGIPSELVIAENDPFSADPSFPPHFGRFVHPLVVARADGESIWIDADVPGPPLPAGQISPELRGRLAMRQDATIAELPAVGRADDRRDEVDLRLAVEPTGDARGTFAVVLRGRNAQELAEVLFRIVGAERQRALRDVVLAWLPAANVEDVSLASTEGSWQVSLRAQISVSGYAQQDGAKTWLLPGLDTLHWVWPRARVSGLAATFATRAGRESDLALSTAVQYHMHRRVELPKGATVARMPGPLDLHTDLVDATRKMSVMSDALEDDFALGVATGTVPAERYDAFVQAAHAADDAFLASTRVTLP
ncbi:MAG TPA: hypothetical protein VKU41_01910 [Polyangiaceae bacterium]|nr:hypothetical protein [Polyangiaceae bacterium]